MPEETAQVQTPEKKSSVLDKNVPNPLAKNPNIHTHKVFASVGLILIGIIVLLSGLAFIYRDQVADLFEQKTNTVESTKVSTSSAKTSTKSAEKDATSDRKTYKGKYFQMDYPSNFEKCTTPAPPEGIEYLCIVVPSSSVKNSYNQGIQVSVDKPGAPIDTGSTAVYGSLEDNEQLIKEHEADPVIQTDYKNIKYISIDSERALSWEELNSKYSEIRKNVLTKKNGITYFISWYLNSKEVSFEKNVPVFDQTLATFKFL